MKRLKDFFYDHNDILIAFLILIAAASLILWRMDAIIEYPREYVEEIEDVGTPSEPDAEEADKNPGGSEGEEANKPDASQGEEADKPGTGSQDTDKPDGSQGGSSGQAADPSGLWKDGVLTKSVEVYVSGASATEALQSLIDAGLFKDYAEYQDVCEKAGLDHQKVSAGSFTFGKGSSKSDIAALINWG